MEVTDQGIKRDSAIGWADMASDYFRDNRSRMRSGDVLCDSKIQSRRLDGSSLDDPAISIDASRSLGDVAWLLLQSDSHHDYFLKELEGAVIPAIQNRQFKIFHSAHRPFAYISWAFLNAEAEKWLIESGGKPRPADWNSGDNLMLIDIVAPFGRVEKALHVLKETIFPGRKIQFLQMDNDGNNKIVGL